MKQQLVKYWLSLKEQEQQLVMIAGGIFVIFVLVMGIFRPLNSAIEKAHQDQIKQQELLTWVDNSIVKLKAAGSRAVVSNKSLSQIVNATRGRFGITISKMQPSDDSLRLTIDSVQFNKLIEWLDEIIHKEGVQIENLDLSRDDKLGYVRVSRLVLEK